jgi:hypothetical protein
MTAVIKDVLIDFQKPQQQTLRDWLKSLPEGVPPLPPLNIRVSHNVDIDDLGEDAVAEWYEGRFPSASGDWVARCYRLLALGEINEAMEIIYRECPEELATPSHERSIAARLSGRKVSTHAEN